MFKVDIFGHCGSGRCDQECNHNVIERDYMFYLSFENSLCDHYVTGDRFNTLKEYQKPITNPT